MNIFSTGFCCWFLNKVPVFFFSPCIFSVCLFLSTPICLGAQLLHNRVCLSPLGFLLEILLRAPWIALSIDLSFMRTQSSRSQRKRTESTMVAFYSLSTAEGQLVWSHFLMGIMCECAGVRRNRVANQALLISMTSSWKALPTAHLIIGWSSACAYQGCNECAIDYLHLKYIVKFFEYILWLSEWVIMLASDFFPGAGTEEHIVFQKDSYTYEWLLQ